MCLTVDEEKTDKMQKKTGSITAWKVYEVVNGDLYSPVFPAVNPIFVKKPVTSDRTRQKFGNDQLDDWERYDRKKYCYVKMGFRGIHVCFNREAARESKRLLKRNVRHKHKKFVIVRCQADMKDFVATGHSYYNCNKCDNGAVFMKIYISPEDFYKALNGDFR